MTRLWLIRHAPTHAKAMIGWTDIPADLSDRAALARLEAALPRAPVVSSDLSRAVATADVLCDARPRTRPRLPHDPALREMNFGAWEGLTHDEAAARDPALTRAFWGAPGKVSAPGGESWDVLCGRVLPAVERLAQGPDLIIVAHFSPILALIQRATGEETARVMARHIPPLSLTRITVTEGHWRLDGVNLS